MRLRLPYEHLEGRFLAGSTCSLFQSATRVLVSGTAGIRPEPVV